MVTWSKGIVDRPFPNIQGPNILSRYGDSTILPVRSARARHPCYYMYLEISLQNIFKGSDDRNPKSI